MISNLLAIVGRLAMIWCSAVVVGVAAKLLWVGLVIGWEVM